MRLKTLARFKAERSFFFLRHSNSSAYRARLIALKMVAANRQIRRLAVLIESNTSTPFYNSMRVPSTFKNLASHWGWAGQAGAVTRLPSTWAWSTAMSTNVPPAHPTSGPTAG